MSIVAPLIIHSPFSDTELYTRSSNNSELPPLGPDQIHPNIDIDSLSNPFPVFQQRHSSPFPIPSHSFSALGPSEQISQHPIPPPPKSSPMDLPLVTPTTQPFDGTSSPTTLVMPTQIIYPPTPDPSPPNSKVLFPDAMIKLAPPSDEVHIASELERHLNEEIPRRLPLASLDAIIGEQYGELPLPQQTSSQMGAPSSRPRSKSQLLANVKSPELKPGRPKQMKRSQTALPPSSVRMVESLSADSRARLRSTAIARQSQPPLPHQQQVGHLRSHSPGFPRTMTDSFVITTPRHSSTPEQTDMGGPDGLEAKVVLLGSQGVGKTSLILRYTTRQFSPSPAAATIGSSLHTRKLVHSGVRVKLQIWDTAGQERFRSMAPIYYRGSHVCVLVYDISDRSSFDDVRSWLEELKRTVPKETVIYVVGAKVDLAAKRAVSLDEAKTAIRRWLKPPPPPVPGFLSPPPRSSYRSYTNRETSRPESIATSPTPIRSRSHSHDALVSLNRAGSTSAPNQSKAPSRSSGKVEIAPSSVPFPRKEVSPSPKQRLSMLPPLQVTSPLSKSDRRLSFAALTSPTAPTSDINTDHVSPSIIPASPSRSRHGVSAGRFSISGVLGYNRTSSMSGAMSNLSRLAEDFPTSPSASTPSRTIILNDHDRPNPPRLTHHSTSPPRVRIDSTPFTFPSDREFDYERERERANLDLGARRKSEEWLSATNNRKSWRMGEGPSAAEALGEFGDGVRKRQSAELLNSMTSIHPPASASNVPSRTSAATMFGQEGGNGGPPGPGGGRKRGGSLGRDSRLYGLNYGEVEEEVQWGVDVEGVRLGECSALTGEGVEALFRSISSILVQKEDKIERERTIRRQGSVMLTDPKDGESVGKKEGRSYGCC